MERIPSVVRPYGHGHYMDSLVFQRVFTVTVKEGLKEY